MARRLILLLLVPALLTLVGCAGGAEEPATEPDSGGQSSPAADSSPQGGSDGDLQTVNMNYTGSSEEIALWVAEQEGLFEERGLDVQLEQVAGAGLTPIGLRNGEIDMGIQTAPDFLTAAQSGLDVVVGSGLSVNRSENPRLFVIASAQSGIQEPAGLEGARIGTPSLGGSFEISTTALLNERGLDGGSVDWVEVPFPQMQDSLEGGTVDAVATAVLQRGPMTEAGHEVILDLSEFQEGTPITFLSTTREYADQNPEVIDAVRAALTEASDMVEQDPQVAYDAILEYTDLPENVVRNVPLANAQVELTADDLQPWVEAMVDQGRLDEQLDPQQLILE